MRKLRLRKTNPHMFSVIYGSSLLIFAHVCLCKSVCKSQTTRKGPIRETLGAVKKVLEQVIRT